MALKKDVEQKNSAINDYGHQSVAFFTDPEDSEKDSEASSSDEEMYMFPDPDKLPADYWRIKELIKYIKEQNPTGTMVALANLNEYDLSSEFFQMAIRNLNALEVLINLLEIEAGELSCKKGALIVLSRISPSKAICQDLTNMGIIPILVNLLIDPAQDLQIYASIVIANVANLKRSSKIVRLSGGIPILVNLLNMPKDALMTPFKKLNTDSKERYNVVKCAAQALASLSLSTKNKECMQKAGIVTLLQRLLRCVHEDIIIYCMGIVQNCGTLPKFVLAIQTLDMIGDIVRLFSCGSTELKRLCALAIFKHSEDEVSRDLIRRHGGLDPLVKLIENENTLKDKKLLAAVTGAIWKCAISVQNVLRFDELNTIPLLIKMITLDEDEKVLINAVGALAECAKLSHNRQVIQRSGGIQPIINILNDYSNPHLLANTAQVLGECANDLSCMAEMEEHDAVRLIWSLLKNPSAKVQANAAWALVPCVQNATDSGEMVRSFVGGIDLLLKLLKSHDNTVLGSICAALSKVAFDRLNLAIVTDLGVIPLLVNLVNTEDDFVKEHLSSAIANCCKWGNNCFELGRLGAVPHIVKYMECPNPAVRRTTTFALCNLSADPFNCITLHQSGVVPFLLEAIGSQDKELQVAAAGCLSNIRRLALAADQVKYRGKPPSPIKKSIQENCPLDF